MATKVFCLVVVILAVGMEASKLGPSSSNLELEILKDVWDIITPISKYSKNGEKSDDAGAKKTSPDRKRKLDVNSDRVSKEENLPKNRQRPSKNLPEAELGERSNSVSSHSAVRGSSGSTDPRMKTTRGNNGNNNIRDSKPKNLPSEFAPSNVPWQRVGKTPIANIPSLRSRAPSVDDASRSPSVKKVASKSNSIHAEPQIQPKASAPIHIEPRAPLSPPKKPLQGSTSAKADATPIQPKASAPIDIESRTKSSDKSSSKSTDPARSHKEFKIASASSQSSAAAKLENLLNSMELRGKKGKNPKWNRHLYPLRPTKEEKRSEPDPMPAFKGDIGALKTWEVKDKASDKVTKNVRAKDEDVISVTGTIDRVKKTQKIIEKEIEILDLTSKLLETVIEDQDQDNDDQDGEQDEDNEQDDDDDDDEGNVVNANNRNNANLNTRHNVNLNPRHNVILNRRNGVNGRNNVNLNRQNNVNR